MTYQSEIRENVPLKIGSNDNEGALHNPLNFRTGPSLSYAGECNHRASPLPFCEKFFSFCKGCCQRILNSIDRVILLLCVKVLVSFFFSFFHLVLREFIYVFIFVLPSFFFSSFFLIFFFFPHCVFFQPENIF